MSQHSQKHLRLDQRGAHTAHMNESSGNAGKVAELVCIVLASRVIYYVTTFAKAPEIRLEECSYSIYQCVIRRHR